MERTFEFKPVVCQNPKCRCIIQIEENNVETSYDDDCNYRCIITCKECGKKMILVWMDKCKCTSTSTINNPSKMNGDFVACKTCNGIMLSSLIFDPHIPFQKHEEIQKYLEQIKS